MPSYLSVVISSHDQKPFEDFVEVKLHAFTSAPWYRATQKQVAPA